MKPAIKSIICIISILMINPLVFAGNEGGGGHTCKSQASQYFESTVETISQNPKILQRYPEWSNLQFVLNPEKNPGFKIEITAKPIHDCPNTQNALACGLPNQNKIQIYCGDEGWNSLDPKEKYKQLVHEIYWWSKLDDSNYFYSNKFVKDVFDILKINTKSDLSLNLKKNRYVYQALTDIKSISECLPKNWMHKRKTWYGATYVYTKVLLIKRWLEDENGSIVAGSLENIVDKQGQSVTTENVHRSEESALNECNLRRKLQEVSAVTNDEIDSAIERFLEI